MVSVIKWKFMGHEWGIWRFDRSISPKDRIVSCIWYIEHFTVGCDGKQNNDI